MIYRLNQLDPEHVKAGLVGHAIKFEHLGIYGWMLACADADEADDYNTDREDGLALRDAFTHHSQGMLDRVLGELEAWGWITPKVTAPKKAPSHVQTPTPRKARRGGDGGEGGEDELPGKPLDAYDKEA